MANDNAKEIRARLKLLVEESGVQKKISAENKRIVQNLRERLKTIRDLNKEEKKMLDKMGDQTDQEKLLLRLGTSKDKQTRNYGKVLDTQLKTNIKMAKGDMGVFKTLRMQFQQRKQIKMINNLDKDIQKAKAEGADEEVTKLELLKGVLEGNVKQQKAFTNASTDAIDASGEMKGDLETLAPGLAGAAKKGKEFIGILKKNPLAAMQLAAVAVVALMVKMVLVMRELKKEFGTTDQQTAKLQGNLVEAGFALKFMGISGAEVKATATAIMEEFGNINNVSTETLKSMGKLHATLGIAGADAAKLLSWMEGISGSTREQLLNQIKFQGELAQAKGVAPAAVMKDVASQTELFADFAKDGGANIFEAATQARALGLNLGTVAKIADSLLDFESSVNAQMEASMMIGRNINSDRARQLALQGDLAGMQKEVLKQLGSEAEFNNMNRLQRQAMAKAFGLSTEELSKMVREQEKLNQRFSMVTWFLEKLAAVTGLFTKLRPILEIIGVIFAVTLLPMMIKWTVMGIIGIARLVTGLVLANAVLLGQAAMWVINTIAANLFWAAATLGISLLIAGIVAMIMNWDKVKAWFSDNAGKIASYLKLAFFPIFMIIEGIKLVMSGAKKLASFFGGGGGGEVATEGTVGAQHGGIFTTPTNVNVAEAGTAEAVIPLDPAGIKVNNEDLLEKLDILIATMGGVKTEVREMGVK